MRTLGIVGTLTAVAALWSAGCSHPPIPDFPSYEVGLPDPDTVDEVVFLVGDAGAAIEGRSPVLVDIAARVEKWSEAIGRDSSVSIAFLGDLVYPLGVRDRDHPEFAQDSTHLWAQIGLLDGPHAKARRALGLFLAGNHDWGNMVGPQGVARLRNIEEQLGFAREHGIHVSLIPEAGSPGPVIVDLRNNARIVGVDTHWFLQERSRQAKDEFFVAVLEALQTAGDRRVIFVAHHPYQSAGEHGALLPMGEALGIPFLLKKSGSLVQDLNSPIYLDLLARLRTAFQAAGRPPLVWAGGHDHSLQVLEARDEFEPRYQLVSGSASKLTGIQDVPGLKWGASYVGYMMLFFKRDGSVELFVVASESDTLKCPDPSEGDDVRDCLENEASRFRFYYSDRIAPPEGRDQVDSDTTRTR